MMFGRNSPSFRRNLLSPFSEKKSKSSKHPTRIKQSVEHSSKKMLDYSSILKINAVRSSETSLNFYRTTRNHIPEDNTPHSHRVENLSSNKE
jgi:hypothetical protein